jgi:DNA-binding IscR family transcriptional regulator
VGGCPIEGPIRRLHVRLGEFFSQVTLADLLEDDSRQAPAAMQVDGLR